MSFGKYFRFAAIATAVLVFTQLAYGQTASDGKIANMTVGGNSVRWDVLVPNSGGSITVSFPDGRSIRKAFRAGSAAEVDLSDKQLESLPDGVYNYELRLAPSLGAGQKETMVKARGDDDESEAQRNLRKRSAGPSLSQSGSFAIANGSIVGPGGIEGERTGSNSTQPQPKTQPATGPRVSANTIERLRNHRLSLSPLFDIVHADDVIIQGSLCVGLDCVVNESFGFDTIRLKENNTRIKFEDTSTGVGFPTTDWQLTANDSASGGANKFSIEDITGARVPFTVTGGAPTNSIFVDSTGRLGLRTSTPVLDIHASTSNTPAIRLEQNNSGGFNAQTWDIGSNEANFFVRDVTGGSRLPFRIRPGAPTSSIDISGSGNVGIGTASPDKAFSVVNKVAINTDGELFWGTAELHGKLTWDTGKAIVTSQGTNDLKLAAGSGSMYLTNNGGVQVGSPTGGDKGAGSINAQAVYDDNVLLTDWVLTPNGKPNVFASYRRLFELDETRKVIESENRLPWMPKPLEFDKERNVGGMVTRLWQGQEQQQLYILRLEQEIQQLKTEMQKLRKPAHKRNR